MSKLTENDQDNTSLVWMEMNTLLRKPDFHDTRAGETSNVYSYARRMWLQTRSNALEIPSMSRISSWFPSAANQNRWKTASGSMLASDQ